MNLQETDYDQFLSDVTTVTPSIVQQKATEKMVTEFQYMRAHRCRHSTLIFAPKSASSFFNCPRTNAHTHTHDTVLSRCRRSSTSSRLSI